MSLSTWFLTSCLWSPAFPWLTSLELDYRAQRDHGSPLPALAEAGVHWAVRFCSRQGRDRSVSQLKMRCGLESCSSSSCSNCNSLLEKLQCLTWMYRRYLLKHAWRIIPIAVDFTQRSFYFISSKEIKEGEKNPDAYLSTEIHKIVFFSESRAVCCFRIGGSKTTNELRCLIIIQTSRTRGWAELRTVMFFTHYRLVLLMYTWTPFTQIPVFCWALQPQC